MSVLDSSAAGRRPFSGRRLRFGDLALQLVSGAAALLVVVTVGAIAYKLIEGAWPSMSAFGLGFLDHIAWDPGHNNFAAGGYIFGTAVIGFGALFLATPLALGIALYVSELAPPWVRGVVTPIVETLAAIPSVIMGLWGLLIVAPFLRDQVDPALHSALGFIPLFGTPPTVGQNIFTAIVVLTVMILPIISSISRELFLGVPSELKEAALGLGMTRWEMVRGVVLPYARGGVAAAMILGLGRAVGEAIAVLLLAGGINGSGITWNLFNGGQTLAAQIAADAAGTSSPLERPSLFYLAVILLVFSLVVNVAAQTIIRRSARKLGAAR